MRAVGADKIGYPAPHFLFPCYTNSMKQLTLLLTTLIFSLTMFSSKADAGWKEKLSSAGFAYCLKENDVDYDAQL